MKDRVFYQKSLFDTGVQVWLVDVQEALATQISGTPYLNDQIDHPDFLPCHHGLNFPGLSGLVNLPQSYLTRFTKCGTTLDIIASASSYSSEVFWVPTLVFLVSLVSHLKPNQLQNSQPPPPPLHPCPVLHTNQPNMRIYCTTRLFVLLYLTTRTIVGGFSV